MRLVAPPPARNKPTGRIAVRANGINHEPILLVIELHHTGEALRSARRWRHFPRTVDLPLLTKHREYACLAIVGAMGGIP